MTRRCSSSCHLVIANALAMVIRGPLPNPSELFHHSGFKVGIAQAQLLFLVVVVRLRRTTTTRKNSIGEAQPPQTPLAKSLQPSSLFHSVPCPRPSGLL